jgi:flagellar protein FlbD
MILLTRLNGVPFAINADLIERVETTPDTVVTMVDGRKHVVSETTAQVIDRIVEFRASILVTADRFHVGPPTGAPPSGLRLVPEPEGR